MSAYVNYRELSTPMLLELLWEAYAMRATFDDKGRLRYIGRVWPPVPVALSQVLLERREELKRLLASVKAARGEEVPDVVGG